MLDPSVSYALNRLRGRKDLVIRSSIGFGYEGGWEFGASVTHYLKADGLFYVLVSKKQPALFGFLVDTIEKEVAVQELIQLNVDVVRPAPPRPHRPVVAGGIRKPVQPKPVRRDPDAMMKSELIEELECAPLRHAALPRARVLAWFQRILYVSAG